MLTPCTRKEGKFSYNPAYPPPLLSKEKRLLTLYAVREEAPMAITTAGEGRTCFNWLSLLTGLLVKLPLVTGRTVVVCFIKIILRQLSKVVLTTNRMVTQK